MGGWGISVSKVGRRIFKLYIQLSIVDAKI